MYLCKMCGGEFEESLTSCPICGTKKQTDSTSMDNCPEDDLVSLATMPYVQKVEKKKTEREYYDSVDMRKYKNKVQLGYIMIYLVVLFSMVNVSMLNSGEGKKFVVFLNCLFYIIPTLLVQFTRSRIAAVILVILCVLSGNWLMILGAGFCVCGIFQFKDKWSFYKNK